MLESFESYLTSVVRPISEFQHIQFSTEIIGLSVDKKESSHYEAQSKLDIVENF